MSERFWHDKIHMRSIYRSTHLLLAVSSTLMGCGGPLDCPLEQGPAIRVHARDGLTGAALGYPVVTAIANGVPVQIILPLADDSTVMRVFGMPGHYEVTVAKPGFTTVQTQVDVNDAGSKGCSDPIPVDVTVTLPRAP